MQRTGNLAWTVVLSTVALVCATLTAYWTSVWWRGAKQYHELIAPMCVSAIVAILMLLIVAALHSGRRGRWAVARLSALLMVGCAAAASGVFFAVLDNCRLSCGTRLRAESRSPNGRTNAMLLLQSCSSVARYCPTISHVSVVGGSTSSSRITQTVFSLGADGGVELQWKAEDQLLIRYWPLARVLEGPSRVRPN